jgi:hypothetical protein
VLNQCGKPVSYLQALGVTKIEYHVASHYHSDHIGCTPQILSAFPLQQFAYDRGGSYTTATYTAYVNAVGAKRRTATPGMMITLDAASARPVQILFVASNANGISTTDENDRSLVALVRCGEFEAVFGGLSGASTGSADPDPSDPLAPATPATTPWRQHAVTPTVGQVEVYKVQPRQFTPGSASSPSARATPTGILRQTRSIGCTVWAHGRSVRRPVVARASARWDVVAGTMAVEVWPGADAFAIRYGADVETYPMWGFSTPPALAGTPADIAVVAGEVGSPAGPSTTAGSPGVDIYRSPRPGEPSASNGLVYLGTATQVEGARSDVASAFPLFPACHAGWALCC